MKHEGPALETLTHRLAECPAEFLMEPRIGSKGTVHAFAVVHDLLRELGYQPTDDDWLAEFTPGGLPVSDLEKNPKPHENTLMNRLLAKISGSQQDPDGLPMDRDWLGCVLVACWLLNDDWFKKHGKLGEAARRFLVVELKELSINAQAPKLVTDPDRREELVRLCLKALDLRPKGETVEQAQDRLSTLNVAERMKLLKAVREAEKRAKEIREAMLRKAAEEAAAKYNRE
jgi:hypothetical protein